MTKTVLAIIMLLMCELTFSQEIDDFEKNYYVMVGYSHPQRSIESYNNWNLLNDMKSGKTLGELESEEFKYSEKQIEILKLLDIVRLADGKYYPNISIFNKEETEKLRKQSKKYAGQITDKINNDFNKYKNLLSIQDFENNTFTIFFSYILDDLVWDQLEDKGYKTMRELSPEKPFWSGNIWFLYPKRDFSCGTNKMIDSTMILNINWSYNSGVSLRNYSILSSMREDYKMYGKLTNKNTIAVLEEYGLCKKDGSINFPVIRKSEDDEIYKISRKISNIITNYLINEIDFNSIMKTYNIRSKTETIVILYHEIMWDILNILEEANQIKKPRAFSNPDNCTNADFRDLFFITEK